MLHREEPAGEREARWDVLCSKISTFLSKFYKRDRGPQRSSQEAGLMGFHCGTHSSKQQPAGFQNESGTGCLQWYFPPQAIWADSELQRKPLGKSQAEKY